MELEILFQDEYFVAINKPHGLLVHRTGIASDAKEFALQILREQLGKKVNPVHRLDRKTSGILVFSFDENGTREMQALFDSRAIEKKYMAIVRGYTPEQGVIDTPLQNEKGKWQEAETHFIRLATAELDVPFGKHSSSRYSLLEVSPKTGRMHQIRKHLNHLRHPIIGDRPHGCNKQNRLFLEKWNMNTMLLHAHQLEFTHPFTGKEICVKAPLFSEYRRMMTLVGWDESII
jgi:tRNA pseudouridine65 synthase